MGDIDAYLAVPARYAFTREAVCRTRTSDDYILSVRRFHGHEKAL